jgi:hypothetical protein
MNTVVDRLLVLPPAPITIGSKSIHLHLSSAIPSPRAAKPYSMAATTDFRTPDHFASNIHKSIPILPSSSSLSLSSTASDPMDATPSVPPPMGPPSLSSPVNERNTSVQATNGESEPATNGNGAPAIGAAAAAQQPKVVQTAFIHKLYK